MGADGKEHPLPREKFFIPGSLLKVNVDNTNPLAYGMPTQVDVFFDNSPVFRLEPNAELKHTSPVAWFTGPNVAGQRLGLGPAVSGRRHGGGRSDGRRRQGGAARTGSRRSAPSRTPPSSCCSTACITAARRKRRFRRFPSGAGATLSTPAASRARNCSPERPSRRLPDARPSRINTGPEPAYGTVRIRPPGASRTSGRGSSRRGRCCRR